MADIDVHTIDPGGQPGPTPDAVPDGPPAYDPSKRAYAGISSGPLDDPAAVSAARDFAEMIVDTVREGLLVLDLDLRVQAANESFYRTFGVRPEETVGRRVYELGNGQWDLPELRELLEQVLSRDGAFNGYEVDHAFDGIGRRVMLLNGRRLDDHRLILLAIEDVTERRAAEALSSESRRVLELVLDHIPQGVFWKDREGHFLGTNAVAARATGFEHPSAVVGLTDYDLPGVTPEQAAFFQRKDREVMASGEPALGIEEPLGHLDGTTSWLRTNKVPLRDEAGRVVGVLGTWEDVTEQKRTAEALRQSEAAFRQLADAVPHLVWAARPDGTVTYYNQQAARYDGLRLRDDGSWVWGRVVHPADAEPTEAAWRRAVARGEFFEVEHRLRMADGSYRWHISRALPTHAAEGSPNRAEAAEGHATQWYGTATDIHRMKEAEEALRERERELALVLGTAPVAIARCDRDCRFLFANRPYLERFGLEPHDVVGKHAAEVLGARAFEAVEGHIARVLAGNAVEFETEVDLPPPQGRCYVHARYVPEFSPGGHVIGFVVVVMDITARRAAEAALRENEERLRLAQQAAHVGTWDIDLQTGTVSWSEGVFDLVGLPPAEGVPSAEAWAALLHPEDRERVGAQVQAAIASSGSYENEFRVVRPDGAVVWVAAKGHVLHDAEGRPTRLLGANYDITKRKEAEAALRRLNETLEERVEERTRQVRQHEERIRELSRALALAEQEERRRIAHVLHDDLQQVLFGAQIAAVAGDVGRLGTILDEAMRITRTLSHELSPPFLDGEDVEDLFRWLAQRKRERYGLEVAVDVGEDVSVPDLALRVLLYQLLRELLFNVAKHAGTGQARLVAVRTEAHVRVSVEDRGAGFDPAEVEERGAAGLGLPSVRERVELVGGQLEVTSTPGAGTRVTITVPVGEASALSAP